MVRETRLFLFIFPRVMFSDWLPLYGEQRPVVSAAPERSYLRFKENGNETPYENTHTDVNTLRDAGNDPGVSRRAPLCSSRIGRQQIVSAGLIYHGPVKTTHPTSSGSL